MKNKLFLKRTFNSYEEALDFYLDQEFGHGANAKIAERLSNSPDNEKGKDSWAVMIGRWRNKIQEIKSFNREKVNSVLNVRIVEKKSEPGKWEIIRTEEATTTTVEKPSEAISEFPNTTLEEKIDEYESRKDEKGFSDSEREILLQFLLNHAESLSEGLHRLIQLEKDSGKG